MTSDRLIVSETSNTLPFRFFLLVTLLMFTSVTITAQSDQPTLSGQSGELPASIVRAVQNGDFLDAQDRLEAYIREQSGQPRGWYLLGYVRNRLGVHEEAYDALTLARRLIGRTPDVMHRELGYALAGQGQWSGALEHLVQVRNVTPKVYLKRGQCHLQLKQYEKALSALEPLAEMQGEYAVRARFLRARVYDGMIRRDNDAMAEIRRGLAMDGAGQVHLSIRTIQGVLKILDPQLTRLYSDLFTRDTVDWRRGRFLRQFEHEQLRRAVENVVSGGAKPDGEEVQAMIDRIRKEADGKAEEKLVKLNTFFNLIGDLTLDDARKRTLVRLAIIPVLSGSNVGTTAGEAEQSRSPDGSNKSGSQEEQG